MTGGTETSAIEPNPENHEKPIFVPHTLARRLRVWTADHGRLSRIAEQQPIRGSAECATHSMRDPADSIVH